MPDTDAKPALTRAPTKRYRMRKQAIIRAAIDLINQRGVKGMTLGDVAANLELVPTAVIYYFKRKEDLAAACFELSIARYDQLLDEAEQAPPDQQLWSFVSGFFRASRAIANGEAEPLAVFNDVRALQNPDVNKAYVALFRRTRSLLSRSLPTRLPRIDLNARTHLVLSQLFWTVVWLADFEPEDYDRAAARFYDILTLGMRAHSGDWAPPDLPLTEALEEIATDSAREDFLRAATELINANGYVGASVDKIAANMNVTKGAFYYHFDAKDDLVLACFERTLQITRLAQRLGCNAGDSSWNQLGATANALIHHQLTGNLPILRTSALTTVPEIIRKYLLQKFERLSNGFAGTISDGIADGSIRPVDPIIASQMVTAVINACAELHFWTPGLTPENAGQLYARPALEGIFT